MSKSKEMTRRDFVKTVGVVAGLAAAGTMTFPAVLRAQTKPIRFGQINTTSGLMAGQGRPGMRAAKIAEEFINKAGGVLGRKVEVIQEDDECKPDVGVRKVRKLILQDKVDFLFGTNSSGVGYAVVPLANEFEKIFISTSMGDEFTGKYCSPYIFRIGESAEMSAQAAAFCMCEREPQITKWAGSNPDYVFGHECWDWFQKGLAKKRPDAKIVHEDFPPFGCTDYKPYITAIMESGAEGVFTSAWTGDLINFIKQAKPFGFFDKIKLVNNSTAHATAVGLGDEMVPFYGQARYYPFYRQSETNKRYVDAYLKKYNTWPEADVSGECYAAMQIICAGIEKARTTESKAVIRAIEGMEIEVPEGKKWVRPEDHSIIDEVVLLGKFHKDSRYPFWVYDPKTYFTVNGRDVVRPLSKSTCKMKKL